MSFIKQQVSTLVPEPYRSLLVAASNIDNEGSRTNRIDEITEKLRDEHPQLFWNKREARAREIKAEIRRRPNHSTGAQP